jgi:hypothetical protein
MNRLATGWGCRSYLCKARVGSYSIAGWGSNPPLTLYMFGSSGEGINIPAGADTAT